MAAAAEDGLADSLFNNAMQGQWEKVEDAYKQSEQAPKLKITKSGDTALHIAVSSSDESQKGVALRLLDIIAATRSMEVAKEILNIQNCFGNTALHIAAQRGDVQLCQKMATIDPKLVSVRNEDSRTPLFSAARFGKDEAFYSLHSHSRENCSSFRAGNGDTFLHAAVSGEYFGLAFQILQWYPDLANSMNQYGMSPLHILADAPTAFRSSSRLGPCERIIYRCLRVDDLKEDERNINVEHPKEEAGGTDNVEYTKTWGSSCGRSSCGRLIGILVKGGNINEENPPQQKSTPDGQGNINVEADTENPPQQESSPVQEQQAGAHHYYPECTYAAFLKFCNFIRSAWVKIHRFLPPGISRIKKIQEAKRQHVWASQVMKKLVDHTKAYRQVQNPKEIPSTTGEQQSNIPQVVPDPTNQEHASGSEENKDNQKIKGGAEKAVEMQTPILIAAKNGVTEMVKYILKKFPVAIEDLDSENKNVALLAVENRQPQVFSSLLNQKKQIVDSLLRQLDNKGNNALHLAATYGPYRPWLTPGAALQMQWECKWYKFVKDSMPPRLSARPNKKGQTPQEIFTKTHKDLQKQGSSWLVKTSESCSVVAALIATVAFATSASVPGGLDDSSGEPIFRDKPLFDAFTISSLLALCLSVTALVFFLSILTSRHEAHDFSINLPRKLLFGLTSLFASIGAVLVSFCTGHVFLLDHRLKYVAYPMYAATCFPVTIFALAQLSLYYDLIRVIFKKVPQRSYDEYKTS